MCSEWQDPGCATFCSVWSQGRLRTSGSVFFDSGNGNNAEECLLELHGKTSVKPLPHTWHLTFTEVVNAKKEENSRKGKTRYLFKRFGENQGTFHAGMDTIKDRNSKDLTEAEEIKKRQQEYTEVYKKGLNDLNHHNDVVTYLEPDILEYEVKWALGSITRNETSGGDRISAQLLQILRDDAVKVLHSICQQIWKTQQWPQDWKKSVFIPIPKKGNAKVCLNYCTVVLISHASKVMLKPFKLGFSST